MSRPAWLARPSMSGLPAHAALAVLAFVPLLLSRPGRVAADTRQYLFVDPASFLQSALTLWDPHVHLGTVTHSNIGNVFPMGTFFALTDLAHIPMWTAQRLWVGLLLFVAGAGVLYLTRTLRWQGIGAPVAAIAYMLTPYTLQYSTRTSVLLLPFAALPWMIGLVQRALRTGGWRHPALLALVALATAGANVSALLLVALGPLLWIAVAIARRHVVWRVALGALGRTAVVTVGTCAVWLAALITEARFGLNVLAYTETLDQVSTTSTAHEALRGLGYWLFYGTEARQPNVSAARDLLESTPVLVAGYLLAGLALVSAFTVRWRHRIVCIALVVAGVVVSLGAYPVHDPSVVGRAFKALSEVSSMALALRSSTRTVPLVVLGLALLLGVAVNALWARRRALGVAACAVIVALVVTSMPALFTGDFVDPNFSRPEEIPKYWREAARALDTGDPDTRVLEIPGNQFAAYRWGSTYETSVLATLLERPSVAREQIPYGSAAAADLLSAFDRRIQEGIFEPRALAPVARLLDAGDVLVRSDLEYERYAAPRPRALWAALAQPPPGLQAPTAFGRPVENRPDSRLPLLDAQTLGLSADATDPPPVAVFPVEGVQPVLHAERADEPILLDGDGEGLIDAASAGLVTGRELVLYGASLHGRPRDLRAALDAGATIVITDTNRRRERRWRSTRFTTGITDRAGHRQPRTGQGEADLVVFPNATDADRSVAIQRGATVNASLYGSLLTFDTDQRAANALDGDPRTAWEIGTTTDPVGERIVIRAERPSRTDHVDLLQAQGGYRTRLVSEVTLRFDGGSPVRAHLDESSLVGSGQRITFSRRTFSNLELEITGTRETSDVVARGGSPTGFAEISIPGVQFDELVRLPVDLARATRRDSLEHRLVYVMTRLRSNPAERADEEATIARVLEVPTARQFSVRGSARLSALATDPVIDAALGLPGSDANGISVTSSGRLPGALDQRARAALDGDRATHWTGTFFEQAGSWIEVELPAPRTIDRLDLALVADGRHSVPTQVRIEAGGETLVVDVPAVTDGATPDSVVDVPLEFSPVTGTTFRLTITSVREETSADAFSGRQLPLPIAVAELGLPDVVAAPAAVMLPSTCRDDLLSVDGTPVPVRIVGTTAGAIRRDELDIESCGAPLTLAAGRHELRSAAGRAIGIDIDRIELGSERGGQPLAFTAAGALPSSRATPPPPRLRVLDASTTSRRIRVPEHREPFWLVLGESHSDGWHAQLADGASLGEPALVNGYANGWYVPGSAVTREIELTWTPQGLVGVGLWISVIAALACVVLAARGRRWTAATVNVAVSVIAPSRGAPLGARPGVRPIVTLALGTGVFTWLLVGPAPAIGAAALVALAVGWGRGRVLLGFVALVLVAAGFLGVVRSQAHDERRVGYDWTSGQENEHRAVLTGLMLLAVDPFIVAARARGSRRSRPETADE